MEINTIGTRRRLAGIVSVLIVITLNRIPLSEDIVDTRQ